MRQKPTVIAREIVASSRLFRVEEVQLRFSNGAERTYERLVGRGTGHGAVMIVAMVDDEHVLLVEEYCGGTGEYEISLPKGLIEPDEDVLDAANRELQEEAGFGARTLEHLTELSLSPGYMSQKIQVVLARDLYPQTLPGDEPEPLRVDKVSLRELSALIQHPQFSEGRALAALYLVRDLLEQRGELEPMSHPLLPAVLALVQQAGAAILPFWRQGVQVVEKADASPVTAADLAAHSILADGLQALDANIAVLSEEDADIALSERAGWDRWWLVDPLDGTKEFIADSEEFTVNVALIERGHVVFGVVGIPASGVVYYGGSGLGAWRVEPGGEPQAIAVRETPASGLTVVASRRHGSALQEQLLAALVARVGDIERISVGSSLKFCQLAEGRADFYPRLAPTSQWDTAAAQGVLEGAGGVVLTLQGEPLRYEARESLLNPFFLALPADVEWRALLVDEAKRLTPVH